jgi:hypothetical protein
MRRFSIASRATAGMRRWTPRPKAASTSPFDWTFCEPPNLFDLVETNRSGHDIGGIVRRGADYSIEEIHHGWVDELEAVRPFGFDEAVRHLP